MRKERSRPDRARASRIGRKQPRSSGDEPMLAPPFPWTDRDFAFHAREALRRPIRARSEPRERDGRWNIDVRAHAADEVAAERAKAAEGTKDTSLRDLVAHRILTEAGEGSHAVKVGVDDGIVTLEGPVPERLTKEMIDAIVEAVPGVRGVDNRLCVDWVDGTPSVDRADEAPSPPRREYLTSTRGSPTSTMKRT
jgi:hypothetical protein